CTSPIYYEGFDYW
nr:immunoglobulin heavy chain junction region [Mus musculus]NSM06832.1 immunoglobulin heavy chain junction region [Mus musculus]NSM09517.1 immunoglobulin heavy chain junction region [Mus musculus]